MADRYHSEFVVPLTEQRKGNVAKINRIAKKYGLKLTAGRGYYWWRVIDPEKYHYILSPDGTDLGGSVYIYRADQVDLDWWIDALKAVVDSMNKDGQPIEWQGTSPSNPIDMEEVARIQAAHVASAGRAL